MNFNIKTTIVPDLNWLFLGKLDKY